MRRDDLLDLNDILQHPGRTLAVDISTELEEQTEVDLIEPVAGFLEAVSTGNLLLVTGEFTTRANLECARCNWPIPSEVAFSLEAQYPVEGVPASYGTQDVAKVAPDEPYPMFEANSLMVEVLLREELLAALPLQPLCEHGWEGECPHAIRADQAKFSSSPLRSLRDLVKEDDTA